MNSIFAICVCYAHWPAREADDRGICERPAGSAGKRLRLAYYFGGDSGEGFVSLQRQSVSQCRGLAVSPCFKVIPERVLGLARQLTKPIIRRGKSCHV